MKTKNMTPAEMKATLAKLLKTVDALTQMTEIPAKINVPKVDKAKLRAIIAEQRKLVAAAKKDPKARKFTLVVKNDKGEKIRALSELTWDEAFKQRRDWYKVIVLSMKQRVKMSIVFDGIKVA